MLRVRSFIAKAMVIVALWGLTLPVNAHATGEVTITSMSSFDVGQHMWFSISGNSDCPTPTAYFIIQRWDDQSEPTKTRRQVMYQMALAAFSSGKKVTVTGASCYLNQYLYADQLTVVQ